VQRSAEYLRKQAALAVWEKARNDALGGLTEAYWNARLQRVEAAQIKALADELNAADEAFDKTNPKPQVADAERMLCEAVADEKIEVWDQTNTRLPAGPFKDIDNGARPLNVWLDAQKVEKTFPQEGAQDRKVGRPGVSCTAMRLYKHRREVGEALAATQLKEAEAVIASWPKSEKCPQAETVSGHISIQYQIDSRADKL